MRAESREFLVHVHLHAEHRNLGAYSLVVGRADRLAQTLGELFPVGCDRLGHEGRHLGDPPAHVGDAGEDDGLQALAFTAACRDKFGKRAGAERFHACAQRVVVHG